MFIVADLVSLNYKVRLYQWLVFKAKFLCHRFILFVGPAKKTDIRVFINKYTVVYVSQSVVCHQNSFLKNLFVSYIATGGLYLNMEWRGAIK